MGHGKRIIDALIADLLTRPLFFEKIVDSDSIVWYTWIANKGTALPLAVTG